MSNKLQSLIDICIRTEKYAMCMHGKGFNSMIFQILYCFYKMCKYFIHFDD